MSSSKSIHLIRRGPGWVPADENAEKFTHKIDVGVELVFDQVHSKVDPKRLRRHFAMLRKVVRASGVYKHTEELREALLIATGNYTWRHISIGTIDRRFEVPKSYTEMSDDEFIEYDRDCVRLIAEQLGIDAVELMRPDDGTQKWEGPI